MPVTQVLANTPGPLPLEIPFAPQSDAEVLFVVAGSVWTTSENQMIGFAVFLDGVAVGEARIFSNGPNTHRAVVPQYIPWSFEDLGKHTLVLTPLPGTETDESDLFTVVLMI